MCDGTVLDAGIFSCERMSLSLVSEQGSEWRRDPDDYMLVQRTVRQGRTCSHPDGRGEDLRDLFSTSVSSEMWELREGCGLPSEGGQTEELPLSRYGGY